MNHAELKNAFNTDIDEAFKTLIESLEESKKEECRKFYDSKMALLYQFLDALESPTSFGDLNLGLAESLHIVFQQDFCTQLSTYLGPQAQAHIDKLSEKIEMLIDLMNSKTNTNKLDYSTLFNHTLIAIPGAKRYLRFYGHNSLSLVLEIICKKFLTLNPNKTEQFVFEINRVPSPRNPREKPTENEEPLAYAKTAFKAALKVLGPTYTDKIIIKYNNGEIYKPTEAEIQSWTNQEDKPLDRAQNSLISFIQKNQFDKDAPPLEISSPLNYS